MEEVYIKVVSDVFDVNGQRVALLVNAETAAGQHRVRFNANRLPSGAYSVRMQSGNYVASQKLVITR